MSTQSFPVEIFSKFRFQTDDDPAVGGGLTTTEVVEGGGGALTGDPWQGLKTCHEGMMVINLHYRSNGHFLSLPIKKFGERSFR